MIARLVFVGFLMLALYTGSQAQFSGCSAGFCNPGGPQCPAGCYVAISIANTDATTFTNQPVPLRITSVDVDWARIRSDGGDIRFTANDNVTAIPYFFQSFNYTNKLAVIWIAPASIGPSGSTTVFMKYGNPSNTVTTANYNNVFAKVNSGTSGLLGLYHLDEGSGATSADALGLHNAALVGTPTWTGGDGGNFRVQSPVQSFSSGSSVSLNGTSQGISITGLLDTESNAGTCFWFTLNAENQATGTAVFRKQNTASNDSVMIQLNNFNSTTTTLRYYLFSGGTEEIQSRGSHALPLNTPAHICLTWGSTYGFVGYVDGEVDLAQPSIIQKPSSGSSYPAQFGYETVGNPSGEFWCNCTFDEIAVFGSQLAEWEVKALFERRPLQQIKDASSKITVASAPVMTNGTDGVLEETIIPVTAGSSYVAFAHDLATSKLLCYTSTNTQVGTTGQTWTLASINVLGTPNVFSPYVFQEQSGTWDLLVNNTSYSAGNLSRFTTGDNPPTCSSTWTKQSDILTTNATFVAYFTASAYYPPSGGIEMLVEYKGGDGLYHSGLWSGPNINSLSSVGVTSGLVYGGGPSIHLVGSKFYVLNHGGLLGTINNIPTLGQIQVSTDLQHFIDGGIMPGVQLHGPTYHECDQIATITAIDNYDGAGNLGIYWTGDTDTSTGANCITVAPKYSINMGTYAGTFAQWASDNLSPTFGVEQAAIP